MPWIILFGVGAYLLWKERAKAASAPAAQTMVAPLQDVPPHQDAPQDGGAPAPSDGASGGGGYADPGPSTVPAPAPAPATAFALHTPLMQYLTQEKHATGITQSNVDAVAQHLSMATTPAPAPLGIRGVRVPHEPTAPATIAIPGKKIL